MPRNAQKLLYLSYVAIFGVLIVLIAVSFKANSRHPSPVAVHAQHKQSTAPASGASRSTSTNNGSKTLANTGPGNTISLFIGVSIMAAAAHRQIVLTRLTHSK